MNKLYMKLSVTNIRKNKTTFIPFILACSVMTMMFYMLSSITFNISNGQFKGADDTRVMLDLGLKVVGFISAIILFYSNNFLMKQRSREFGLYSVLGMEKKHIGKIIFGETFIIGLVSLVIGIGCGIIFSKLMFLLFINLLHIPLNIPYVIDLEGIGITAAVFAGIYVLLILINLVRIYRLNALSLLSESKTGEREPKLRILTTMLGVVCLAAGYFLALKVDSPIDAALFFFVAVMLVIIGTYCLFMSGSIAFLKLLKKNKKYYYHKTHFITVSGMMHRMKQNALGLATICILCTMVFVSLSSTVALYVGMKDQLDTICPKDVMIEYLASEDTAGIKKEKIEKWLSQNAQEYNVSIKDVAGFYSFTGEGKLADKIYNYSREDDDIIVYSGYRLEDYYVLSNKPEGEPEPLLDNEIYIFCNNERLADAMKVLVEKSDFSVKQIFNDYPKALTAKLDRSVYDVTEIALIAKDIEALGNLTLAVPRITASGNENVYSVYYNYTFDLQGSKKDKQEFSVACNDYVSENIVPYGCDTYYTLLEDYYYINGSFLFIGIFLGTLFLLATALIIYYKQLSEGYDDRNRFKIMENVGMSHLEISKVIKNQIITVFALPILVAVVHIIFAFSMIKKILKIFSLTNVPLFVACTIGTVVVFSIIYGIVYILTARVYYRIVKA